MTASVRTRITGLLTCGAVVAAFVSLRFARSAVQGMLQQLGGGDAALSKLAGFALAVTSPVVLVAILVGFLVAVAAAEVGLNSEHGRLMVQAAVLLLLVLVLAVALSGFLVPFHIPDVHIR